MKITVPPSLGTKAKTKTLFHQGLQLNTPDSLTFKRKKQNFFFVHFEADMLKWGLFLDLRSLGFLPCESMLAAVLKMHTLVTTVLSQI